MSNNNRVPTDMVVDRSSGQKLDALLADNAKQIGGFLDVKKYAKGDWNGTTGTDDTANIQSALQYANDNKINHILIFGNFLVNGSLSPFVGQTIQIEGQLTTTGTTNTVFSISADNVTICGSGLLVGAGKSSGGSSSGVVSNANNTTIKDIKVTGFSNVGVGTGTGASRPKIKNVTTYENKTGISVYKSNLANVSNCESYNNGIGATGGGIMVLGVSGTQPQNFVVSNNNCHDNYATGITVSNANRGTVSGNSCNNNGGAVTGQGSGIVLILDSNGDSLSDVSITGNNCNQNSDHGIVVQINKDHTSNITGINVSANTASSNYKTGIRFVNGIDVCVISGNTCNSNGSSSSSTGFRSGIMVADRSTRNQIIGNTCLSNAEDGIRITDKSTDFTDSGSGENTIGMNNFRNNTGYGINIFTSSVTSSANRILSNFTRGNTAGDINDSGSNTDKSNNRSTFDKASGTSTLVAGTATISTTEIKAGNRVILSVTTSGGTQGALFVSSITDGTNFTVKSTSSTDTSTFSWKIDK